MKKLKMMNIKEDNILNRDEMKAIIAGSGDGGCSGVIDCGSMNYCSCTYNGCQAELYQCNGPDYWYLRTCDGLWCGSGQYGGTTCGGQCP